MIEKSDSNLKNLKGISGTSTSTGPIGTTVNLNSTNTKTVVAQALGDFIFTNNTLATNSNQVKITGIVTTTNFISTTIVNPGQRLDMSNDYQNIDTSVYNITYISLDGTVNGTLDDSTIDFFEKTIFITNITDGSSLAVIFNSINGPLKATFTNPSSDLILLWDNILRCWHVKYQNCFITDTSTVITP